MFFFENISENDLKSMVGVLLTENKLILQKTNKNEKLLKIKIVLIGRFLVEL